MTLDNPTHTLKLADGYGSTPCELLDTFGPLATVRVPAGAYWQSSHPSTRTVLLADLSPLTAAEIGGADPDDGFEDFQEATCLIAAGEIHAAWKCVSRASRKARAVGAESLAEECDALRAALALRPDQ